ncbi:MAG: glycosyltransferase [Alphaproteobacteria bacterium]|nr:glycosyltransferase [Alphaproteobacteria bacterium]
MDVVRARKKIAFILPNFNAGGAERVMITIANHLDRLRFEPVLIVFDASGPLASLVAKDIPVTALGVRRVSQGLFVYIKAIRQLGPDAVISTMVHLNFIVLLARIFVPGVPVIVREAVTPSYFADKLSKRLILSLGYLTLYPFAEKIVSPTQKVFDEMPWLLRQMKQKLVRIFNPVDLTRVKAVYDLSLRGEYATPEQKLFVAAGRLVDQKGFDLLIDALAPWRERDDWRLVILGEGPDHQKLQDQIDALGLMQITLKGFVAEPWRYYAIADAFLLPSRHEGLPNVALEALAMGAPVIAAQSAGGIAEIAQQGKDGSVRVAASMPLFLNYMGHIPISLSPLRPTRLPEIFSIEAAVVSYQDIFLKQS